jgi:predicted phosphodiesterase
MRIAIVSDIHGNRTGFEAVLADLRLTLPDLILHGGDLVASGASPAEIVDCIRDLGWQGVVGNTDEMLFRPESLTEFAAQAPKLQPLVAAFQETAAATREALGEDRLAWLRRLPSIHIHGPMALVHASPKSLWRAPALEATDGELESVYEPLGQPLAVYAHIHRSYIRTLPGTIIPEMIVANTGSVSLSYDGDRRAAYLLLDDSKPTIRRVEYDVDKEIRALSACGLPHSDWIAKMLDDACFQMP